MVSERMGSTCSWLAASHLLPSGPEGREPCRLRRRHFDMDWKENLFNDVDTDPWSEFIHRGIQSWFQYQFKLLYRNKCITIESLKWLYSGDRVFFKCPVEGPASSCRPTGSLMRLGSLMISTVYPNHHSISAVQLFQGKQPETDDPSSLCAPHPDSCPASYTSFSSSIVLNVV